MDHITVPPVLWWFSSFTVITYMVTSHNLMFSLDLVLLGRYCPLKHVIHRPLSLAGKQRLVGWYPW